MSLLTIKSRDSKTNFLPGETLEGQISWQLNTDAEALELRLIWFTSGKGDTDVSVENTLRFEAPALVGNSAFRFVLPLAPHSFSGQIISLSWALELVVIPGEDATRWEFFMAPGGQEILLSKSEVIDDQKLPVWLKNKLQRHTGTAVPNSSFQENIVQSDAFTSSTSSPSHDATDKPFSR